MFSGDARRLVIEVSVATLRFWLANPNFRSILTAVPENSEMSSALSSLDTHLLSAIAEYERAAGTPDKTALHSYTVRALIYGTVMLISRGDLPNDETTISKIRAKLEEEFS